MAISALNAPITPDVKHVLEVTIQEITRSQQQMHSAMLLARKKDTQHGTQIVKLAKKRKKKLGQS